MSNIKDILTEEFKVSYNDKVIVYVDNKQMSVISGLTAFMLIVSGSVNIEKTFYLSIAQILYGFLVMLPVSYINMKKYEEK